MTTEAAWRRGHPHVFDGYCRWCAERRVDRMRDDLTALREQIASLERERAVWARLNMHDEAGLALVRDRLEGSLWLADPSGARGPYAYDDPAFREEFGAALRGAIVIIDATLRNAPVRPITLDERAAILKADDERLRCGTCGVAWAEWESEDRVNHAREHADS